MKLLYIKQISINGLISFDRPIYSYYNRPFPSFLANFYVIAPFWDDINTSSGGTISYETYEQGSEVMSDVSYYVSNRIGRDFVGYWMIVIFWDEVHPYSFPPSNEVSLKVSMCNYSF